MRAAALLLLLPGLAVAQNAWVDIVKESTRVPLTASGGTSYGDVAAGFSSFLLDLGAAGPLTLEVNVTEIRQGAGYEDDDSRLFLFDQSGRLVAENDDNPLGGYSSLINGFAVPEPGRYYAVVTTYPNRPELDDQNRFQSLGDDGESNFSFELIVENQARPGPLYGRDGDSSASTAPIELARGEFRDHALPVHYKGGEMTAHARVDSGVTLFFLTVDDPVSLRVELLPDGADEDNDSMLFVFDHEGGYVVEDDDGGPGRGSLIPEIYLNQPGGYYLAVTSYPNRPVVDSNGFVAGFPATGEGDFEFALILGPASTQRELAPLTTDPGIPATSFNDIIRNATPVTLANAAGTGSGEVGTGFAAFAVDIAMPSLISMEVVVTAALQGTVHTDGDSVLTLFDSNGAWYAANDDGGTDGASRLLEVPVETPGTYFAVVTTYPNEPVSREGFFTALETRGESRIRFDLVVRTEPMVR